MGEPSVRARHLQLFIEQLRRAEPKAAPAVEERLGEAEVRRITAALSLSWLPVELDVATMEAGFDVLGRERLNAVIEARQQSEIGSPLMQSFVAGVTRAANLAPDIAVRPLVRAWGLVFRDAGNLRVTSTGPGTIRIEVAGLPQVCVQSQVWMDGLPAALGTFFRVVEVEGRCRWESIDPEYGGGLIIGTW